MITMSDPSVTIQNAIYSWWVHPLAVRDGDYLWLSSIARMGTSRVHRLHVPSGTVTALKLGGRDTPDDHNAGVIAYHPERSTLLVFYSRHAQDRYVRWRHVNRTTLNVSASERRLHFPGMVTYAQVLQEPGGRSGRLVVLCRVDMTRWQYRMTTDWGASWTSARTLVATAEPGQYYCLAKPDYADPAHVQVAFCGHPANSTLREIRAFTMGLYSGSVRSLDGVTIGDFDQSGGPDLRPDDLDVVVSPAEGDRVRLLDVTGHVGSRPVVAYAQWTGAIGDAAYRRTDVPDWSVPAGRDFGHSQTAHYVGGCVVDPDRGAVTARQEPVTSTSGTWVVERWDASGQRLDTVATGTAGGPPLVRPHIGGGHLVWQRLARYDSYQEYDADLLLADYPAATSDDNNTAGR